MTATFPLLDPKKRPPLCKLLETIRLRPEQVRTFREKAKAKNKGLAIHIKGYDRLAETLCAQFPECRDEIAPENRFPATVAFLQKVLKTIDRDCCNAMGAEPCELDYFIKTGTLSPLLAERVKGKK